MPRPAVLVEVSPRAVTEAAFRLLTRWARDAADRGGRVTLALSGGRTPRLLYSLLADAGPAALPYQRLEIFWSDERAVPPDHPDSNYRLARDTWLARAPLRPGQVHRIAAEHDPARAAGAYEREVLRVAGTPPRFDAILLGVGRDGHTASLFPRSAALTSRALVATSTAPGPPRRRVTFTPALIQRARHVLVLVSGSDKAQAVAAALGGPMTDDVPASLLRGETTVWVVDESAAGRLATLPRAARATAAGSAPVGTAPPPGSSPSGQN